MVEARAFSPQDGRSRYCRPAEVDVCRSQDGRRIGMYILPRDTRWRNL